MMFRLFMQHTASPTPFLQQSRRLLLSFVTVLPVFIFVRDNVACLELVNGPSMAPFLNGDYNKTTWRDVCLNIRAYAARDLERGMIVTFRNPMHPEKGEVIKRIVALPGDIVTTKPPCLDRIVRVPPGHIWVEGDGDISQDSNTYGPISMQLVTGKISHVLFPWEKARRLEWWKHPNRPGVLKVVKKDSAANLSHVL